MDKKLEEFINLQDIFHSCGYSLYLVGGSVRDYLLNIPLTDMDLVTNATPDQMKLFLKGADFTFARFGSVKYKINDVKFDITTLRKEKHYKDSRHPLDVKFISNLKIDVKRRDFTINGLYMDEHFHVLDYVNGKDDLSHKVIKMIGNPDKRIKEDPLRIIRAIRFAIDLDFNIDLELNKAIKKNISLIDKLTFDKVKQEIHKIKNIHSEKVTYLFTEFNIKHLLDVIE